MDRSPTFAAGDQEGGLRIKVEVEQALLVGLNLSSGRGGVEVPDDERAVPGAADEGVGEAGFELERQHGRLLACKELHDFACGQVVLQHVGRRAVSVPAACDESVAGGLEAVHGVVGGGLTRGGVGVHGGLVCRMGGGGVGNVVHGVDAVADVLRSEDLQAVEVFVVHLRPPVVRCLVDTGDAGKMEGFGRGQPAWRPSAWVVGCCWLLRADIGFRGQALVEEHLLLSGWSRMKMVSVMVGAIATPPVDGFQVELKAGVLVGLLPHQGVPRSGLPSAGDLFANDERGRVQVHQDESGEFERQQADEVEGLERLDGAKDVVEVGRLEGEQQEVSEVSPLQLRLLEEQLAGVRRDVVFGEDVSGELEAAGVQGAVVGREEVLHDGLVCDFNALVV